MREKQPLLQAASGSERSQQLAPPTCDDFRVSFDKGAEKEAGGQMSHTRCRGKTCEQLTSDLKQFRMGRNMCPLLVQGWEPLPAWTWPSTGSLPGTSSPTSILRSTVRVCQDLLHLWAPLQDPHPMRAQGSHSLHSLQRVLRCPAGPQFRHRNRSCLCLHFHS